LKKNTLFNQEPASSSTSARTFSTPWDQTASCSSSTTIQPERSLHSARNTKARENIDVSQKHFTLISTRFWSWTRSLKPIVRFHIQSSLKRKTKSLKFSSWEKSSSTLLLRWKNGQMLTEQVATSTSSWTRWARRRLNLKLEKSTPISLVTYPAFSGKAIYICSIPMLCRISKSLWSHWKTNQMKQREISMTNSCWLLYRFHWITS